MVRPQEPSFTLVEAWLLENGLHHFSYNSAKDWITVSVYLSVAETLLDTRYEVFQHEKDGEIAIRCLNWSIPTHLHEHIEAIQPTTSFWRPKAQDKLGGLPPPSWEVEGRIPTYQGLVDEDLPTGLTRHHIEVPDVRKLPAHPTIDQACNRLAISPACLRVLYGSFDYVPQVSHKNRIALVNFLGNVNNRSDINMYLEAFRPDAAAASAASTFQTELVADGEDLQRPLTSDELAEWKGFEGALDAETVLGLSWPTQLTAYNVGGRPPTKETQLGTINSNEPYMEWLQYMLAQDSLPSVITISYADEEQTVPPAYAKRVCQAFAQLGARGVSVFVASGDDGVGLDEHCFTNGAEKKPTWLPTFPASCPYVTAVGATRLLYPEQVGFDARDNFTGGGGFSNYFPRPRYQDSVVPSYVNQLGDNSVGEGLYNKEGRGIPDISAQGYHYVIVWNQVKHLRDGTSASSPTVASLFALINDALIAEGKPPMGFLNPWLYSVGCKGLTDVTLGSARGCNSTGFPAIEGWDAVTGLGTPVRPI